MGFGPTFADVLDAALQSAERQGNGSAAIHWPVEPQTPFVFAVAAPDRPPSRGQLAPAPLVAAAGRHLRPGQAPDAVPDPTPAPPPRSPRPARHLPLRHQLAFDALADLGATLRPDFTLAELRSAFRALARRYHPDRHTAGDGDEQHRRARLFAAATDHYHCLIEVVRPRRR